MRLIQTDQIKPGVWAIIYCKATDTFLFGKRSSLVNKGGAWNFFGGRLDRKESPTTALCRELEEEIGLTVSEQQLVPLALIAKDAAGGTEASRAQRELHFYALAADSRTLKPRLNFEHSKFGWFSSAALPSRLNKPTALAIENGLLGKASLAVEG